MRGLADFGLAAEDLGVLTRITQHACQSLGGTTQTYCLARHVLRHRIPGVFVECGLAAGAQLAAMALAMVKENDRRKIYGFDSFEGIPHAGPKDEQQPGCPAGFLLDRKLPISDRLRTTGVSAQPEKLVRSLFESWGFTKGMELELVKGWFQNILPWHTVRDIAFLRLDGDLAESTECCLINLYDHVVPNGLVYVDDYGLEGCKWAVHAFLEDRRILPELFCDEQGNPGAVYWFK